MSIESTDKIIPWFVAFFPRPEKQSAERDEILGSEWVADCNQIPCNFFIPLDS